MKKTFFIAFLFCLGLINANAQELEVKITPDKLLTTSNNMLMEGDIIDFKTVEPIYYKGKLLVEKNSSVTGSLTSREENGYRGRVASLYFEDFKLDNQKKLNGIVYVKGNFHPILFEYFIPFKFLSFPVRGGEVQMIPEKSINVLFLEVE